MQRKKDQRREGERNLNGNSSEKATFHDDNDADGFLPASVVLLRYLCTGIPTLAWEKPWLATSELSPTSSTLFIANIEYFFITLFLVFFLFFSNVFSEPYTKCTEKNKILHKSNGSKIGGINTSRHLNQVEYTVRYQIIYSVLL